MAIESSSILFGLGAAISIVLYAFFVCVSIVIARSRPRRVRELSNQQVFGSRYALYISKKNRRFSLAAHVGIFLSVMAIGFFSVELGSTPEIRSWVSLITQDVQLQRHVATGILLVFLPILALISAQVAKAISFGNSEIVLCYLSLPIIFTSALLSPIRVVLTALISQILGLFNITVPKERELVVSVEEINELVEQSSEAGEIEEEERELIQGVFTFSNTLVKEVMTQRKDVIAIEQTASLEEIVKILTEHRLSRIVVIGENLDDLRGIIIAKDLLPLVGKTVTAFDINDYLRPAYVISGNKGTADVLQEMQKNAVHFAVVQDEHGGVDGVVTVEDLVEEIVGEIADEHDTPEDELDAVTKSPGEMTVDGGIKIDDINEILPKPLPAGEYETVAGFIMHILGRLPKQGEEIPYDGVRFKIAQMEQTRINSVTIYFGKKINQLAKEAPKVSVGHGLTETEDHEPLPKIA